MPFPFGVAQIGVTSEAWTISQINKPAGCSLQAAKSLPAHAFGSQKTDLDSASILIAFGTG